MTRIEKAVREVSDLRDFYRRIPKIGEVGVRRQGHGPSTESPASSVPADAPEPRGTEDDHR